MASNRQVSAFDIIGPIMVGPSSSHTAGAVRLGQMGRVILGTQPAEALIELHGSFAQTGQGHGADRAIIAGLLGMSTDDERIRHSFAVAEALDMKFRFEKVDLGEDAHPNTVRLTLRAGETSIQVTGASIGGGLVEITNIEGYEVNFGGQYDTLLVIAEDRPGTINAVTGWLLTHDINVAFFRVGRKQRGGEALMIIETDQPIPDDMVEAIEDFDWVRWVRKVDKVGE